MSNEQYVHIGAYLEVDLKPEKIVHYTYECKKHPETRYMDEQVKFCSICGKKLRKVRHITEEYKNYWEISEKDETFWQPDMMGAVPKGKMYLISNKTGDGTCMSISQSSEGIFELHDHNVYISKMYQLYNKKISALVKNEFVNKLTYKCGVIVYWS